MQLSRPKPSELEQVALVVFLISPSTETASLSGQPVAVFDMLPPKIFIRIDEIPPKSSLLQAKKFQPFQPLLR